MIQQVFETVKTLAYQVQTLEQLGLKGDGRGIWGGIEVSVKDITLRDGLRYQESLKPIYSEMERVISSQGLDREKMPDHYFTQLKDLVDKKSDFIVKPNRVLQLAYNIGQLMVFYEKELLPMEVRRVIGENRLFDLETYLDRETLEKINEDFRAKLSRGGGKKINLLNLRHLRNPI